MLGRLLLHLALEWRLGQRRPAGCHDGFGGVALAGEAAALAVVAFGLSFVALLLTLAARVAACLRAVAEHTLSVLRPVDLHAGGSDFEVRRDVGTDSVVGS